MVKNSLNNGDWEVKIMWFCVFAAKIGLSLLKTGTKPKYI